MAIPTGSVVLSVDGVGNIRVNLDANGNASGQLTLNDGNQHTIGASYSGDPADSPSSATPQTVTAQSGISPTQTTMTISPNPPTIGQPFTVSVSVTQV